MGYMMAFGISFEQGRLDGWTREDLHDGVKMG